jgi:hypothetical protein
MRGVRYVECGQDTDPYGNRRALLTYDFNPQIMRVGLELACLPDRLAPRGGLPTDGGEQPL